MGVESWSAGCPGASCPHRRQSGAGRPVRGPGPTHLPAQPPRSLLRSLAGSHLPAGGTPGPLVLAPGGPVVLAGRHLGCRLLGRPLLGLAAALLPALQPLLLLLGCRRVLVPVLWRRVCRSTEPVLGREKPRWSTRASPPRPAPHCAAEAGGRMPSRRGAPRLLRSRREAATTLREIARSLNAATPPTTSCPRPDPSAGDHRPWIPPWALDPSAVRPVARPRPPPRGP